MEKGPLWTLVWANTGQIRTLEENGERIKLKQNIFAVI